MSATPSLIEIYARRLCDMPAGHVARLEDLKHEGFDGFRLELVTAPAVKSGPRNGKPNWRSPEAVRVARMVPWADMDRFADEWSDETGKCSKCVGDGQVFQSWHHIDGTTFRPCPKCDGTGQAKAAA